MRLVPALLLALLIVTPSAVAKTPPEGTVAVGPVDVSYFLTRSGESEHVGILYPSELVEVHADLASNRNGTYRVTLSADGASANATMAANLSMIPAVTLPLIAPDSAVGAHDFVVDVLVESFNGTNVTREAFGTITLSVVVVAPQPPGLLPTWAWFVIGAAVLAAGGFAVQRARKRQVRVAPRSRTLQELQVEDKAEKVSPKRQAEVEAARQEVETREAERLAVRENSILDAKRNDILRSIELMKQRHERGELTAFQYQKLKEKKEAQLAELERGGGA